MATFVPPKRAVALTFYVGLVGRATRPQLQANPTLAAGDVQVSKDGGAFANLTTLPVVTPASGRAVKVDLSATEMTADQVVVQFVDAAGAEWDDLFVNIQTAARQIDDLAFPNVSGRGADIDAAGGVEVGTFQAGAITAAAFAAGAIDAAAIAANAITAAKIATDAIDNTKIAAGAITSSEAPNLDAAVSTRASQASVDVIDDFLDTEVAAILAAVDTEVAAILANTDVPTSTRATPSQVNTEVVDVLKVDTVTLPGQVAPPLTPTFEQIMAWLYKALRNRKTQTATLWALLADDEVTVDAKATVSDDGTTAVKQEVVSGP